LHTCLLNFASAKNPGGGFLRGACAQEESLALSSGLYPCLMKPEVAKFYEDNERERTCVYTDHMIMSPAVPVFKNDGGCPLDEPYAVGMLTAPAPNMGVAAKRPGSGGVEAIRKARQRRMERVVQALAAEGFDAVVLGAWGCGVFQNDPEQVAQEFHELLCGSYRGVFRRVVFAVLDQATCAAFESVFFGRAAGCPAAGSSAGAGSKAAARAGAQAARRIPERAGKKWNAAGSFADAGSQGAARAGAQAARTTPEQAGKKENRKACRWRKQRDCEAD